MDINENRIYIDDDSKVVSLIHGYCYWKQVLQSAEIRNYYFQCNGVQGSTTEKTFVGDNEEIADYLISKGYKRNYLAEGVIYNPYNEYSKDQFIKEGDTWKQIV